MFSLSSFAIILLHEYCANDAAKTLQKPLILR